ncbi:hypothetical protein ACS0TY_035074 [Phlomoides rotata]
MSRPVTEFKAFLDETDLLDVEASGFLFTWSTRHLSRGFMAARLDRALVNQSFLDPWHSIEVVVLHMNMSDHHPLLINFRTKAETPIHRPFRFQAIWTQDATFLQTVTTSWQ